MTFRTQNGALLFRELPEEYRYRDREHHPEPGDLEAYLHGFGYVLDRMRLTLEQSYADAFAALPAGTVESLLKPENKEQLVAVLTYHVIPGKVMSSDIAGKTAEVETVQGSALSIDATSGVMVDNAMVTTPDIITSNGIIHVIDKVVLPN